MSNEAPRYWRGQDHRYLGVGSRLLKTETVEGVDEEGKMIKGIRVSCPLLDLDWSSWWMGPADDKKIVSDLGKELRRVMEARKFSQEMERRALFEVALAWGKGGEDLINGIISGGQEDLVKVMKEMGYGRDEVKEWLFSVNGYKRESVSDQMILEGLVGRIFDSGDC